MNGIQYKKGDIVKAKVSGVTDYGIFVKLNKNYTGLIHISSISEKFVKDPNAYATKGDVINVEILDIDQDSMQMKLSIKNIRYKDKNMKYDKIVETEHGFTTLESNLPKWIEENLKSVKKD